MDRNGDGASQANGRGGRLSSRMLFDQRGKTTMSEKTTTETSAHRRPL